MISGPLAGTPARPRDAKSAQPQRRRLLPRPCGGCWARDGEGSADDGAPDDGGGGLDDDGGGLEDEDGDHPKEGLASRRRWPVRMEASRCSTITATVTSAMLLSLLDAV